MYRVFLTNFGNELGHFDDFAIAKATALAAGFETTISEFTDKILGIEEIVGWFSPISGWHSI